MLIPFLAFNNYQQFGEAPWFSYEVSNGEDRTFKVLEKELLYRIFQSPITSKIFVFCIKIPETNKDLGVIMITDNLTLSKAIRDLPHSDLEKEINRITNLLVMTGHKFIWQGAPNDAYRS